MIACVFVAIVLHFINPLAAPVSNLVGWGFPAYLSFKALETPQANDDVQWLTYWVVFGFFNLTESFALRLVLYYIPWYFTLKTLFVIWLQLPVFRVRMLTSSLGRVHSLPLSYQGAQTIYVTILKPVLANVSNSRALATTSSPESTAENLRDRVASSAE